ncbi:MAG: hypothetical protein CL678_15760 [Bdellovibrionaceae bacterium]|nr:hypothetical protein [Pseudobdellovibrionaceae bacterium]
MIATANNGTTMIAIVAPDTFFGDDAVVGLAVGGGYTGGVGIVLGAGVGAGGVGVAVGGGSTMRVSPTMHFSSSWIRVYAESHFLSLAEVRVFLSPDAPKSCINRSNTARNRRSPTDPQGFYYLRTPFSKVRCTPCTA